MKIGRNEYWQLEGGEVYAVALSYRGSLVTYARGPLDESERPASPTEALADKHTVGWLGDHEVEWLADRDDYTVIKSEAAPAENRSTVG